MWPISSAAANALLGSHGVHIRATAFTAALGAVSDLPVTGGSVTVDSGSQTRRTATVQIADPQYWPSQAFSVLSPLGSELLVEYGIVLGDGSTEYVPVIRGPITDVQRRQPTSGNQSSVDITVHDRSAHVAEARFETPQQTIVGATTVSEIRRLITDALPGATVTDLTGSAQVAAQLTIERERWADGIEKLADSLAGEVFATPVGAFTIRPQPTLTGPPVWLLGPGAGAVVSVDQRQTRELAYSKVVASGQRTDGIAPVWAAVSDTDPTSPTYINGPFGTKTRFFVSPLLTTVAQCIAAAAALLERTRGMSGSITLTTVTNPALDVGDVVAMSDTGTLHIIDTLTVPLSPTDAQTLTTRSLSLPPEFG